MRPFLSVAALLGVLLSGALAAPSPPASQGLPLQADLAHPLWSTLAALHLGPAQWAALLTTDGDHDGRTDFLDLLLAKAPGDATPVELLVYASAQARANLQSRGGVDLSPVVPAVFLTVPLRDVPTLAATDLVVFEPRVFASASTNPAGGSPSTMPQTVLVEADQAWTAGYTGSGVTIAILDTGVDTSHQALDGGKVTAFKDCTSTATAAYDDHGHGTHVASIAAGDDGTDFRGVAYQASIVAVKVLDAAGSGSLTQFSCGATYVRTGGAGGGHAADIASMSAGLGVPPLGVTTLNGGELDLFGWDAVASTIPGAGIPFTVAAGNWVGTLQFDGHDTTAHVGVNGVNQVSSPGYSPAMLTVGAVDAAQAPATFSALGPGRYAAQKPDVAAQGRLTWGALKGTTSSYERWDGTSMATPQVAGILALLMDKTSGLSHTTYENAIRNGAVSACIYGSGTHDACYLSSGALKEPNRPNFVDGYGIAHAGDSLALV